jgi:hypothetical protein
MIRWIAIPLVAAAVFVGSGFANALDRTTHDTVRLAESTREAPESTREAERSLGSLPAVARLTGQQAAAARALATALGVSAGRVDDLNGSLGAQARSLDRLRDEIMSLNGSIACIRGRTQKLLEASIDTPGAIRAIVAVLIELIGDQDIATRHLRSINRKLAALGVVATATDVHPPPTPTPPGSTPGPGPGTGPVNC